MVTKVDDIPPMDDAAEFDGEPIPLTYNTAVNLPPFPVDALPDVIANMVTELAEATQTSPAMAGTSALSALSTCSGGHAEIEIRFGWREPLSLYTATVAEPGERKSAVQQEMTRPLLDAEKDLVAAGEAAHLEAQTNWSVANMAAEKMRRAAAGAKGDEREAMLSEALHAAQMADAIKVPPVPRLLADDITPEAAASLLAEQGGRLSIISAEGGIFDIIGGRYNAQVPNLDLWLKGHSGDPIRIDRKNRPPEYIRRPALTLGLMIQPEVLRVIAAQRQFRGRGLLARVLYAMPPSMVGHRRTGAAPIAEEIAKAYSHDVHALAVGMAGWLGDPAVLTLTPKAHEAITAIEATTEPTLAADGELAGLKDWGSKYVGAVARIAGILHLAQLGPERGPITPVDAEMILKAARIGGYFKAAAIVAFAEMEIDRVTANAVYLLGRLNHLGVKEISERDMHRACQSRFRNKDALLAAVDRLVDHGYLVPLPVPRQTKKGRPASPSYRVYQQTSDKK
jgi:replicative DNA helicase